MNYETIAATAALVISVYLLAVHIFQGTRNKVDRHEEILRGSSEKL